MILEPQDAAELELYRSMFRLSLVGAVRLSTDGTYLWVNEAFANILGYKPEEIIGKPTYDITHPEDRDASRERIMELFRGEVIASRADRRFRHKDGHYVWVSVSSSLHRGPDGKPLYLAGLMVDISERKLQELRIRESEKRFNSILSTVQDVVWSFSAQTGKLLYINESATKKIYDRDAAEFYADPELWTKVVHPSDRARVGAIWHGLAHYGTSEDIYRVIRPDGTVRSVHARAWTTRGPDGEPLRFEGVVRDVTDILAGQRALQESEARQRQLMASGRIGIWELNPAKGTVEWSQILREICGIPPDEPATLETFRSLYHPEEAERMERELAELIAGGPSEFEPFRIIRRDGKVRWLKNIGHILREGSGDDTRFIGSVLDVTSMKEAELTIEAQKAKMAAASKMSALGEMAGGLAHEINNPVAIIQGNATILRQMAAAGRIDVKVLDQSAASIEKTAARIATITRSLRAFARDGDQDPFERVSVKGLIDETAEFCRQRFREHGIELQLEEVEPGLDLRCRPVQVSQVLLNLLNNSHDAVHGRNERWIRVSARALGDKIELSVTDSGPGIPPELREKIFQPFFTTKEVGRGTGLGLSVAKGIVESHQGTITVDPNHPNTRFVVTLPRS